jgi:S1-C subfamily serine protease
MGKRKDTMMKQIALFLVLSAVLLAAGEAPKPEALLESVVRVSAMAPNSGTASGVIIEHGGTVSFILTNAHVAILSPTWWIEVRGKGKVFRKYAADVHMIDRVRDVAVLMSRIRIPRKAVEVLHTKVKLLEKAWAVGCPDGMWPIPVGGTVADVEHTYEEKLPGMRFVLVTAPTWPGMSGGALFVEREGKYLYAGMPSRVRVQEGFPPTLIPHLNMITPVDVIREALEARKLEKLLE